MLLLGLLFAAGLHAQGPSAAATSGTGAVDERIRELERDPRLKEQALRTGRKVAEFCAACHGDGGNSVKPDVPNLAGQNSTYLLDQVRQFADGRRKNMFMEGLTKALREDEKVGLAVFYASQEVTHRAPKDAALAARGKAYYDRVCFACHGEHGRGSEKYARIAGQQAEYLTITLKRYRDGSAVRANPVMAGTTRQLSDPDLDALVAYIASMR